MKTINFVAIALLITLSVSSCTPKMTFTTSTIVPSATGEVKVKKDKNKNYIIDVNVINLAEPQKLTPAKTTYLVWMESRESRTKKLGQIMPASKLLKASLSATATDEPTDIFITAEDNVDIQYPDGPIILTTKK
ncbi:hypothetical protein [Spirosoma jeollabukense]